MNLSGISIIAAVIIARIGPSLEVPGRPETKHGHRRTTNIHDAENSGYASIFLGGLETPGRSSPITLGSGLSGFGSKSSSSIFGTGSTGLSSSIFGSGGIGSSSVRTSSRISTERGPQHAGELSGFGTGRSVGSGLSSFGGEFGSLDRGRSRHGSGFSRHGSGFSGHGSDFRRHGSESSGVGSGFSGYGSESSGVGSGFSGYGSELSGYGSGNGRYDTESSDYTKGLSRYGSGISGHGSRLKGYGSGLNTYGSGLNTYGSGLSTYGSGLNTFGSGLSTYGSSLSRYGTRRSRFGGNSASASSFASASTARGFDSGQHGQYGTNNAHTFKTVSATEYGNI